jgi:hypothetical protein
VATGLGGPMCAAAASRADSVTKVQKKPRGSRSVCVLASSWLYAVLLLYLQAGH